MIVDERMTAFINSLDTGNTPFLTELEVKALEDHVPIIRREMQSFLKVLLQMQRPVNILEVGTAVGFSTLLFCEYAPKEAKITTIEKYEKRIPIAKENFRKAGKESQIRFLEGDATEILAELEGSYDFIFMDAAKGQYIHFLPDVMRLLKVGGILISDNVLQDGDIIESHYAVERRNRTIYKRMREYLYELKHNEHLMTSIVPIGDGATLSVKIKEKINGRKNDEETRIAGAGKQPGSIKDGGHLWSGCRLHWRRSIWTACKSQEFFDGRYERGHCLCP